MSHPREISWLPKNTTLIAPVQALAAAGNLQLNSKVPGLPQGPFIYDKVIRQVQIFSVGDLAAVTFTITGIGSPTVDGLGLGNPTQPVSLISEMIAGPSLFVPSISNNIYQQIISITADAPVLNVSVGSGPSGITDFVFLNYNSTFGVANCSIQFLNYATISAIGYNSLNKIQVPDINTGNLITTPFMANQFIASGHVNVFQQIPTPSSVVWLNVQNTTVDSLIFTTLQQGVYP